MELNEKTSATVIKSFLIFFCSYAVGCGQVESKLKNPENLSSLSECSLDQVLTSECTAKSQQIVTETWGSNISGANAALTATIPQGYYSGLTSVTLSDTNLVSTNIKSGVNIFGTTGTLTEAYAACSDDTLNASACSTAANRYVTSTAGTDITTGWANTLATTSVSVAIPDGYYKNKSTSLTDNNLVPGNIKSGVSIFGVLGTLASTSRASNTIHDVGTTQLTQKQEVSYPNQALPAGYRDIPDINKDDDGTNATSPVVKVNRGAWLNTDTCGTNQATLEDRIADCAAHTRIGAEATWNGTLKGNAGQGTWKLVTRKDLNKEVWRDEQTGLVWSSVVGTSNWCLGTGNAQSSDTVLCAHTSNQAAYPTARSFCSELGTEAVPITSENYSTGVYQNAKGGLGKIASGTSPSVMWRMPSLYDYKQADIHGIRFVFSDMGDFGGQEWTATINADGRSGAWLIDTRYDTTGTTNRSFSKRIRCVGR